MSLKINSDILEVINSGKGTEPVAYIDIYAENGDYSIIDTQNEFKAATDPVIINDVDIDFDRKPGFAVLAPGKKVDAATTADFYSWGDGTVDWSPIGISNPLNTLSGIYNIIHHGITRISGTLAAVVSYTRRSNNLKYTAVLKSTDNGLNFIAVNEVMFDMSTGIQSSGFVGGGRFTNGASAIICSGRPGLNQFYEIDSNLNFIPFSLVFDNPAPNFSLGTVSTVLHKKRNGLDVYTFVFTSGGVKNGGVLISTNRNGANGFEYSLTEPISGFAYNNIDSAIMIGDDLMLIAKRNSTGSDIWHGVNLGVTGVGFFMAGHIPTEPFKELPNHIRDVNGILFAMTSNTVFSNPGSIGGDPISTSRPIYKSVDNGLNWVKTGLGSNLFLNNNILSFSMFDFNNNSLSFSSTDFGTGLTDVTYTSDGVNFITEDNIINFFFDVSRPSPTTYYNKKTGELQVFRFDLARNNRFISAPLSDSFEYIVNVRDVYNSTARQKFLGIF